MVPAVVALLAFLFGMLVGLVVSGVVAITTEDAEAVVDDLARLVAGWRTDQMRGGAAAARWAHNPEVAGSSPAPASNYRGARP
jgi:hypothetical protein